MSILQMPTISSLRQRAIDFFIEHLYETIPFDEEEK